MPGHSPSPPVDLPSVERLLELIASMKGQPVVLLADLVADRFISGSPKRISREAPVLILSYEGDSFVPGGGANAVANITTDLVTGYCRQTKFFPQQVNRLGQVGDRIDQSSVEVEKKGINWHIKTGGARGEARKNKH